VSCLPKTLKVGKSFSVSGAKAFRRVDRAQRHHPAIREQPNR
jgi:hypothetical protein